MANVTIKLTVDTVAILGNPTNPDLVHNCRLSQAGGEENGNNMFVDFADPEQNESHVTLDDIITWEGIPANGDSEYQINIESVVKEAGSPVLGNPLDAAWTFGTTKIRQATQVSPPSNDIPESYAINFSISTGGSSISFRLDPKIRVHQH